jgi:hypothetical protein
MADGNGTNGTEKGTSGAGKPSNGKGVVTTLVEGSKVIRERALEEVKALKQPEKTDVWKSVLRVSSSICTLPR